jgi:UDP-N-acetylglucosamine 2-epimerase (non-hydrolysing)
MTVGFIFGTRPEITKSIGIARAFHGRTGSAIQAIATGQQTDLVRDAFADFDANRFSQINWLSNPELLGQDPNWSKMFEHSLLVLRSRLSLTSLVGTGDTQSVMLAATFCREHGLGFIHLEAGIRHLSIQGDLEPEERNRRGISLLADVHCCPTARQRTQLLSEGHRLETIHVLGDLSTLAIAETWRSRRLRFSTSLDASDMKYGMSSRPFCVCTFHRSTSYIFMDALVDELCDGLDHFSSVMFLVCRRPDTRWDRFYKHLYRLKNVRIVPAPGPLSFQGILCHSDFVITDSAGVQQEALLLNKPVIALRSNIELLEEHPLLALVRPPYTNLSLAISKTIRRASISRETDVSLHCHAGDLIAERGAYLIGAFDRDRSNVNHL